MPYYEVRNCYLEHINNIQIDFILKSCCSFYAFILHDKDKFADSEELKKPHYHICIYLNSKDEKNGVESMFQKYDNTINLKNVKSPVGLLRYLTHKDNLDKYQYNDSEVLTNDLQQYKEFVFSSHKMSDTDMLLNQFLTDMIESHITKGVICDTLTIFQWFRNHNKLSYAVQHIKALKEMLTYYKLDFDSKNELIEWYSDNINI